MNIAPAAFRRLGILVLLLVAVCLAGAQQVFAQTAPPGAVAIAGGETGTTGGLPSRAEITAFTVREVAFGLAVLLVCGLAMLTLLPSGTRPRGARGRDRGVFP